MELFEELERIKIRFVAAYDKLVKQGVISERDYQEILEIIDDLDSYSLEELQERLGVSAKSASQDEGPTEDKG